MARVVLRPARMPDLDAIVAIERVAFSDPPWSRRSFAPLVGDPRVRFFVAAEVGPAPPIGHVADAASVDGGGGDVGVADIVVGYVVAWIVADEGEIANLAVTKERRRSGIGRRLLEAAVSEAEAAGARMLYLEVRESNAAARALYRSGGFIVVGRRSQYYRNPAEDALVLRLDLPDPLADRQRGGGSAG